MRMHFISRAMMGLVLSLLAGIACADGFSASGNPQAPPSSSPVRACNGCCCNGGNTPHFMGSSAADPVWTKDGSLLLTYSDLSLGSVMPIEIIRNYDSKSQFDSNVGYGWAFSFDQRLFQYPDGSIVVRSGVGRLDRFVYTGGAYVTPPGGSQGQLTAKSDGTFEMRYRGGTRDLYDPAGRLISRIAQSGAKQELIYDSRGKLPLVGTSPKAVNTTIPMVVAYLPRVTKIQERGADGTLTGYFVSLTYSETTGRVASILASDGRSITYVHDVTGTATKGNLVGVSGLTDYAQTFAYADPVDLHNLTTITDGTGAQPVVNTFDTSDRVKTQVHGTNQFDFAYPALGVTQFTETVRNASGSSVLQTRVSKREFNAQEYLSKETDALGNETRYFYDSNNQLSRMELWDNTSGALSLLKAIDTTYSPDGLRLLEEVTLDSGEKVTTTLTYDQGWMSSEQSKSSLSAQLFRTEYTFLRDASNLPRAVSSVRRRKDDGTFATTTYTYCSAAEASAGNTFCPDISLVKTIDGPRSDVSDTTQMSYYVATSLGGCGQATGDCFRRGDLRSITNALGQSVVILRYDSSGRPVQVQDANGVITEMTYHPRGWLTQSIVKGLDNLATTDDAKTIFQADPRGNLTSRTTADGTTASMTYDSRNRLSVVRDQAGNELRLSLDSAGNRLSESAYDPANVQKRSQSMAFDKLNRLVSFIGSTAAQTTTVAYDAANRPMKVVDANLHSVTQAYDDLDRVTQVVSDSAVGGINATTSYKYDAIGNTREISDPKGLSTTYVYDSLSNLLSQTSPDAGASQFTYDAAGNRSSETDARGVTVNFSYDALNRLISASYPTTAENVQYIYDVSNAVCLSEETFAVTKLSKIIDQSGTTEFCYNRFGDTVRKVQTTAGHSFVVRYVYKPGGGKLQSTIYPDGSNIDYVRNSQGKIQEVGATIGASAREVILASAAYYPAGPSSGWTFGNGRVLARTYDKDYRASTIRDISSGGLDLGFRYDNAGQLTQLTPAASSTPKALFGFDALGRLVTRKDGASVLLESYTYDGTGNRTSKAEGTSAAQIYDYTATSHRLSSVAGIVRNYNETGGLTSVGGTAREYSYNNAGRMASIKQNSILKATYRYNALGQQVQRTGSTDTVFVYNESSQLLGQYSTTGVPLHQYVWMDGQAVAVIASAKVLYVETDHLGTPRSIVDPVRQKAVWSWDLASEAFGSSSPNTDPDVDGTNFVYDLRFSGQRYDSASGAHYNVFRDYDPAIGRYSQRDPIGLAGGVNTYDYVVGNPLQANDRFGLEWEQAGPEVGSGPLGWIARMSVGVQAHDLFSIYVSSMGYRANDTNGGVFENRRPDAYDNVSKQVWELKPISNRDRDDLYYGVAVPQISDYIRKANRTNYPVQNCGDWKRGADRALKFEDGQNIGKASIGQAVYDIRLYHDNHDPYDNRTGLVFYQADYNKSASEEWMRQLGRELSRRPTNFLPPIMPPGRRGLPTD